MWQNVAEYRSGRTLGKSFDTQCSFARGWQAFDTWLSQTHTYMDLVYTYRLMGPLVILKGMNGRMSSLQYRTRRTGAWTGLMHSSPGCIPRSVEPGEQVHKQDGLAKEVGQQNGQPDLCVVLQPMKDGCGWQEQASKNLTQHLHRAYFCSAEPCNPKTF